MEVVSIARNIRVSPQKVRLVARQIKNISPQNAISTLGFINKSSAKPLTKAIASAIANARNNFNLDESNLKFKSILVSKGIVFKRHQPVAKGRAHPILKPTSHITVILEGETKKETKVQSDKKVKEVESTNDKRLTTKAK